MSDRKGLITMQGNPLTLTGNVIEEGDVAPDVTLLNTSLEPVSLGSYKGKVLIVSAVPSLDTSVCSVETKRFNDAAGDLSSDIQVITVSMDLPFAQKRWVDEHEVTKLTTLSDHREAAFGQAYGVLVKELRLLARAIFVVDRDCTVRYTQLVPELTDEPDYAAVLDAAKKLV